MATLNNISSLLMRAEHHLAKGEYQDAHSACIDVIKINPNTSGAYYLLAILTAEHENHIKACELFVRAITLDPDQSRYHANYAQVLTILGRQNEAKESADTAASLNVDNAFTADKIGVVYSRTGFHEKAVPFFRRAIAYDADPANFHYNLGASAQFLGDFSQAKRAYRETLKREPDHYRAWSSLVGLEKQSSQNNHIDKLTELFERNQKNPDAALHYGHAIAKTLEDIGQYPQSLAWLKKAKQGKLAALDRAALDYNHMFKAAVNTLPASPISSKAVSKAAPIFIFGLPRTGTTLVDRIISSHPNVTAAGELNIFAGLIKEAAQTPSNMVMDCETLEKAVHLPMALIGQKYMDNTHDLARGAARMTDKMPLNFFYAGLIHRALPHARLVVLRRGAMDSCLSNYRQLFTVQYSYYNYTYDLEDTAKFYSQFDNLIAHWRKVLPANRFMEIHYEDIVFDQENQTRKLLEFCDLPWDETCMKFHENKAPVSTASSVQVRQPLYSGSINRWKKYGDELALLQKALGIHARTKQAKS